MKSPPIKQHWLERCVDIHNFHVAQIKAEPNWTVEKTAEALCRSVGSVSQDLLLARWLRTHEKQLRRCSSMKDAIAWIHIKQREMKTQELEL